MSKRRTGSKQRDRVIAKYGQNCWYCKCETVISNGELNCNPPWNMFTVDHFIPIARGGSNRIENLRPSCADCNNRKGNEIWDDCIREISHKTDGWSEATPKMADIWPET